MLLECWWENIWSEVNAVFNKFRNIRVYESYFMRVFKGNIVCEIAERVM